MVTEDGESIEVDIKVANVSGTIGGLLEVFDVESNDDDISVPLPNVNGKILRLVLEWAEKHRDDPISTDTKRNSDIPAWDAEFLAKLEQGEQNIYSIYCKIQLDSVFVFFFKKKTIKYLNNLF